MSGCDPSRHATSERPQRNEGGNSAALVHKVLLELARPRVRADYFMTALTAAWQSVSSWEPVPPEQPIAPMDLAALNQRNAAARGDDIVERQEDS